MNGLPRVVLDCVVFLQGAGRRTGPSRRCLELVRDGAVLLCLSPPVVDEIRDVLGRTALALKFPDLNSNTSIELIDSLLLTGVLFDPVPKFITLPRDPKDEIYLDLAAVADADYLVTWNERHLTYLMTAAEPEALEFRARLPKLRIIDPPTLLSRLKTP